MAKNIHFKNRHLTEKLTPEHQARVDVLIAENRGLIGTMIHQVFGNVAPDVREELFADGLYCLWRAARAFDPTFGWKFSTLACTSLRRTLQNQKIARMKNREHVADDRQWEVITAENASEPETSGVDAELSTALRGSLSRLDATTAQALSIRYLGEEYGSIQTVAEQLGVTREKARRICNRGLILLRRHLEKQSDGAGNQPRPVRAAG